MNRDLRPIAHPTRTTACRETTSMYSSNLTRSWPPGVLQTHSITASKCLTKHPRLWTPSSHNHGLQMHHLHPRLQLPCDSLVQATGPGNSPAVRERTAKTVRFGSDGRSIAVAVRSRLRTLGRLIRQRREIVYRGRESRTELRVESQRLQLQSRITITLLPSHDGNRQLI